MKPVSVAVTDAMLITDAAPGTTLNMALPITDSAAMNDVMLSWAAARRSAFAASAAFALNDAVSEPAGTQPASTQPADAQPAGTEQVNANTQPAPATTGVPIPPRPAPALTVTADSLADGVVASAVRLRIEEELGSGPNVSHIAMYQLPNSNVISGLGLIPPENRDQLLQLLQGRVDASALGDAGWSAGTWPGVVFGSVLADLQLGGDGSLTATIEPRLLAGGGKAQVVRLRPKESKPLLSPEARWLIGRSAPKWATKGPDCRRDRCVALTFDDGPSPDTPRLLEVLDRAEVQATFFMIGLAVQKRPEIAAAVANAGHVIGNHTWSHTRLGELDLPGQQQEVFAAEYAISSATGVTADLLRPPYGVYDDDTRTLGFGVALWSVDTNDWNHQDPTQTVERALVDSRPGSIVLMHDLYAPTVDAAALVIAGLRSDDYRLVSMGTLSGPTAPGTLYYEQSRTEALAPPPAEPAPAQSNPAQSNPAQSTPGQSTPAQSNPAQSTPVQSTPAQSAPESAPGA